VVMSLDYYNSLMETVHLLRSPFEGVGKPEPLKENLSGFWSRRIDDTNRLVYAIDDNVQLNIQIGYKVWCCRCSAITY
jgi:Txe/YoeB family toxin of toxin-antitoxin system